MQPGRPATAAQALMRGPPAVLPWPQNRLTTLPPAIGEMRALQELWVYSNQLTSVSPHIGQLTALKRLWLDRNQLTTVPRELAQLSSLQELVSGVAQAAAASTAAWRGGTCGLPTSSACLPPSTRLPHARSTWTKTQSSPSCCRPRWPCCPRCAACMWPTRRRRQLRCRPARRAAQAARVAARAAARRWPPASSANPCHSLEVVKT